MQRAEEFQPEPDVVFGQDGGGSAEPPLVERALLVLRPLARDL